MQTAVSSRMRLEVRFAGVLLTFGTTPVVGELVRATQQPRSGNRWHRLPAGRVDRGEERLRGQVLRQRAIPEAGDQIPKDPGSAWS